MGDSLAKRADPVCDVWKAVLDRTKWVQADEPYEGPWVSQLLRSNTRDRCEVAAQFSAGEASLLTQALPAAREASILAMYQQAIDHADRFIYIENQYLIGSGARWADPRTTVANDLPERIVNKILAKRGQPFHVYVVTPMFPEGNPVGTGGIEIRNYEWRTIRYMVETLNATLGASWSDYLTLMFLADWREVARTDWSSGDRNARLRAHQRYMVYVHSKMMIVDDRFIIFGSEHQVIDNQRVMPICKEVAEPHLAELRRVILIEVGWPLAKDVVRHAHAQRQSTTQGRHALHLVL